MKRSVVVSVFVSLLGFGVLGCESSETESPQESRLVENDDLVTGSQQSGLESAQGPAGEAFLEYTHFVEGKLRKLKAMHLELVDRVKQGEANSDATMALDARLEDLTKKGEEIQRRIEYLKAAKGEDWLALQAGVNQALDAMAQSYEKALAQLAG
ncbi:MAG: hypothetical protein KC643_18170 [Nitrospira sp.]|nr:hypothetical protein [Nitrospira sp.]MDR4489207.1 hypothetical protein [Nitrospirales bacterium]